MLMKMWTKQGEEMEKLKSISKNIIICLLIFILLVFTHFSFINKNYKKFDVMLKISDCTDEGGDQIRIFSDGKNVFIQCRSLKK